MQAVKKATSGRSKKTMKGSGRGRGTSYHTGDGKSDLSHTTNRKKNDADRDNLEALSSESMEYCSRFHDGCAAPKCPLDILIDLRIELPGDPKCEMAKATRQAYFISMPKRLQEKLPYGGLLESEYNRSAAAKARWESFSEEEKQAIIERGKEALQRRFNQSGGNQA